MSELPTEPLPDVVERIKQLQQAKIQTGELIITPFATFHFPYLSSPKFLDSVSKDTILALDLPTITTTAAKQALEDLKVKQPVIITTLIPEDEEKWHIIPSLGIGGRAFSSTEIRLYFDPEHPAVVESLSQQGARQVAHEINHTARFQGNKIGNSLLDAIITEGLATYYEERWEGEYLAMPWGNALTPAQIVNEWQKAKSELEKSNYDYRGWFFGRNSGHPQWTGYSLGTAIVNEYFKKHPKDKMAKVVRKNSREILKDSGFNPTS
jgi:uncharacterized protein YjaZ